MIIDLRQYTVKPEKLNLWLTGWERVALPLEKEILGNFLGAYMTDVGPTLNEVIFLVGYESMADREIRRGRLYEDPRFIEYRRSTVELEPFINMSSRIICPTDFSPRLVADYPEQKTD